MEIRDSATGIVYERANSFADSQYGKLEFGGVSFRSALTAKGENLGMPLAVFTEDATKNMTARDYFECIYNMYY